MFQKNDVLLMENTNYRVLFVDADTVGLYDMDNSKSGVKYQVVNRVTLTAQFNSGQVTKEQDPYEALRKGGSSNDTERMDASYALIESIVSSPNILYSKHKCAETINSIAGKDKALKRKIYRLIGRWFQRGQCKGALLPDYRAVGKSHRRLTKSPGRKGDTPIPVMNNRLQELMTKVINKFVLVENSLSLQHAYSELLSSYKKEHSDSDVVPSINQFRNFYYKVTNRRERNMKRNAPRIFNKDIQAKMGSVYDAACCIGEVYEVDATVDNVYLVSSGAAPRAVGRPVLYTVTDRFSGMIVGFSVLLENAQYRSAAEAIYCAIADKKKYFKDSFGIDLPFEWDVSGIPAAICADNAELEGTKIEHFLRYCHVKITNTAPYRADQKGTVENSIFLVQQELKSFIAKQSHTSNRIKKAGGQDNRAKAVLTLQDYRAMVLYAVDIINHRLRNKMPADYPTNLDCNPSSLWKWAALVKANALCCCDNQEALRLSLLPKHTATVSRDGIKCLKITYTCAELEKEGWFDRDGCSKSVFKPNVSIDSGNVANAWIYPDPNKHPEKYYRCQLAHKSSFLDGCCMYEAKILLDIKSASIKRTQSQQDLLRRDNRAKIKEIVDIATERVAKCASVLSEKAQKDLIKESRINERIRDACARALPTNELSSEQDLISRGRKNESDNDFDNESSWDYADRFSSAFL